MPYQAAALSLLAFAIACGGGDDSSSNKKSDTNTNVSNTSKTTSTSSTSTTTGTSTGGTSTGGTSTGNTSDTNTSGTSTGTSSSTNTTNPGGPVAKSALARVKFKGGPRWSAELSRGLELPANELCNEFKRYNCVKQVHAIALGGVEPYKLGVTEPFEIAPVTSPIAVDRVALSACVRRARLDFESDNAVIFGSVKGDKKDAAAVGAVIEGLYQRLLSRNPDPQERQALAESVGEFPNMFEWGASSCFAIATSTEMLFY